MKVDPQKYAILFPYLCLSHFNRYIFFISYDIKCIDLLDCLHLLIDWSVYIFLLLLKFELELEFIFECSMTVFLMHWHNDILNQYYSKETSKHYNIGTLANWHIGIVGSMPRLATVRTPFVNAGSIKFCKYFKFQINRTWLLKHLTIFSTAKAFSKFNKKFAKVV